MRSLMNEFSLLSLNTFGIPFFLGWGRLARLASELDNNGTAIICLQEIQQNAYVSLLARSLTTFPHRVVMPQKEGWEHTPGCRFPGKALRFIKIVDCAG